MAGCSRNGQKLKDGFPWRKHHATIVRTDLILVERSPGWRSPCMSLVPRSACGGSSICARILSFSDSRWVWMGKWTAEFEPSPRTQTVKARSFWHRIISQWRLLDLPEHSFDFTIRIPFFVPMNIHESANINYQTSRVWSKAKGIAIRFRSIKNQMEPFQQTPK